MSLSHSMVVEKGEVLSLFRRDSSGPIELQSQVWVRLGIHAQSRPSGVCAF